jgi:lysophospholipase L1-like esterase
MSNIYGVVLVVGDSLASGARDEYGLSMPRELGRLMSERYKQNWIAVEKGVNGETSSQLLRRFYDVCRSYPEAAEIVVCIGTNDAKADVATPPEIFEQNYREIIRTIKVLKKPVLMCKVPPPEGFGAPDRIRPDLVALYNDVILKIAHEGSPKGHHLVWYVELDKIAAEHRADGIHLTHAGNIWFANETLRIIERERNYECNSGSGRQE